MCEQEVTEKMDMTQYEIEAKASSFIRKLSLKDQVVAKLSGLVSHD